MLIYYLARLIFFQKLNYKRPNGLPAIYMGKRRERWELVSFRRLKGNWFCEGLSTPHDSAGAGCSCVSGGACILKIFHGIHSCKTGQVRHAPVSYQFRPSERESMGQIPSPCSFLPLAGPSESPEWGWYSHSAPKSKPGRPAPGFGHC
jgi:hypothetical protein